MEALTTMSEEMSFSEEDSLLGDYGKREWYDKHKFDFQGVTRIPGNRIFMATKGGTLTSRSKSCSVYLKLKQKSSIRQQNYPFLSKIILFHHFF